MRSSLFLVLFTAALPAFSAESPVNSTEETFGTQFSIKATDHLIFSSSQENGDKTVPSTKLFMNEAAVRAEYGNYNGMIQFSNRFTPDGNRSRNAPFKLEKKTVALASDHWDIKLGDSRQELGRGIALSLYNDAAFGIDNTLEGVSGRFRNDDFDVAAFAGRVNSLRSPVAINPDADPLSKKDVWMASLSTAVKYSSEGKIGAHYLLTQNQDPLTTKFTRRQHTVGATLSQESLFEGVDAYAETNFLTSETLQPIYKYQANGYASYGALSYSANPWKIKTELKDYRSFDYDWRRPPTMEEDVISKNNFTNVTATRVLVERRLSEMGTANVFASYLVGMDRDYGAMVNHPVVGAKIPLPGKIDTEVRGGYRWLPNRENVVHAALKGKIRTGKGQAFEAEYRKQFWHHFLESPNPTTEERNMLSAGYIFNEQFSVLAGYEYIPTNSKEDGKNFVNGGANYKTGALNARAFVGQTSGGTQCSGGVCRTVPPYTGAYVETTYTF